MSFKERGFEQKRTKQTKEMGISSSFLLKTATTDLPRQCYALIHDLFLRSLRLLLFNFNPPEFNHAQELPTLG